MPDECMDDRPEHARRRYRPEDTRKIYPGTKYDYGAVSSLVDVYVRDEDAIGHPYAFHSCTR